ncbi:MAG: flavin reductase family protein [Treponema sp.]|nr:flavin reductase family protein [Treponema sp.]
MKEIRPEELNENPFTLIGKDWMLITAQKEERTNMMTASWGGMGVLWGKNVATVYIRRSRFTKTFVDQGDTFSLCVLGEEYRKQLAYLGKASGRDEDKVAVSGLTVEKTEVEVEGNKVQVPFFKEARLVLICKKLYAQEMQAQCFTKCAKDIPGQIYADEDWHTTYVGEIVKILEK